MQMVAEAMDALSTHSCGEFGVVAQSHLAMEFPTQLELSLPLLVLLLVLQMLMRGVPLLLLLLQGHLRGRLLKGRLIV